MMLKGILLARKKKAIGNGHIKLAEKFSGNWKEWSFLYVDMACYHRQGHFHYDGDAMTMRRRNKLNEELFAGSGGSMLEEVVAVVEWKPNPEEEY